MGDMLCRYNVETPMCDGVILRGDLYRPEAAGAYPVLLWRTIFRKNTLARMFGQYDPAFFVQNGYAVFIQDVRGLGESDGAFDRFTADSEDGYDTVEWLAAQDFCDGNVGMIGNYYAGYLQLMAAAAAPPHLKAICPMQTSVSINRDCDNRGFMFYSHIGWCMSRQISRLRDGRYDKQTTDTYLPLLLEYSKDYIHSQLLQRPLRDMPAVKHTPFALLKDYYKHLVEGYDNLDLMHKEGRDMDLSDITIPAFYIAGWYDSARTPLVDHCRVQRQKGTDSRVLIAPWNMGELPARADSALENGVQTVNVQQEMVEWFDHHLKGAPAPAWDTYRYYDIVTRQAYAGKRWYSSRMTDQLYYLSGGSLLAEPGEDGADTYVHDPSNPLPFVGFGPAAAPAPAAHTLVYTAAPAAKAITLQGMVQTIVYLSSDARDADAVLRLYDLAPDGKAFVICDGATRARYRNSWQSQPLEHGAVYPLDVLMGYVRYTVQPGHRLALTICGSAFPKYDINYGTAVRPPEDTGSVISHNAIHSGPAYPSRLVLPVEPEGN